MVLHSTPAGLTTPTYRAAASKEELSRRAANAIDAYLWTTRLVPAGRPASAAR